MIYRIFIGTRELDVKAPTVEDAFAVAARQYPGERITAFFPVPEETPEEEEGSENGD